MRRSSGQVSRCQYRASFDGNGGIISSYDGPCRGTLVARNGAGGEQLFEIEVPADGALRLTLVSDDSSIQPALIVAEDCTLLATECLIDSETTTSWVNPSSSPQTVTLSVDPATTGVAGEVVFNVEIVGPEGVPEGNLCSNPLTLGGVGQYTVTGSTSEFFNAYNGFDDGSGGVFCATEAQGSETVRTIEVPNNHRVRVTPGTSFADVRFGLFDSCSDVDDFQSSCLNFSAAGFIRNNTSGSTQNWFLLVDGRLGADAGDYEVFVIIEEIPQ